MRSGPFKLGSPLKINYTQIHSVSLGTTSKLHQRGAIKSARLMPHACLFIRKYRPNILRCDYLLILMAIT